MRNLDKIREKVIERVTDKYHITINSRQVLSIIIAILLLFLIVFFAGFFIGQKDCKIKQIECEVSKTNITLPNTENKNIENLKQSTDLNNKKEIKETIKSENKQETKITNIDEKNIDKKNEIIENKNNNSIKEEIKKDIISDEKKTVKKEDDLSKIKLNIKNKTTLVSEKKGDFVLQLHATPNEEEANEIYLKLKEVGFSVYVEKTNSKGTVYNRVRIGYFSTKEKAKEFKDKFVEENGYEKTFVTTAK